MDPPAAHLRERLERLDRDGLGLRPERGEDAQQALHEVPSPATHSTGTRALQAVFRRRVGRVMGHF